VRSSDINGTIVQSKSNGRCYDIADVELPLHRLGTGPDDHAKHVLDLHIAGTPTPKGQVGCEWRECKSPMCVGTNLEEHILSKRIQIMIITRSRLSNRSASALETLEVFLLSHDVQTQGRLPRTQMSSRSEQACRNPAESQDCRACYRVKWPLSMPVGRL
jgi:hypothetical protein